MSETLRWMYRSGSCRTAGDNIGKVLHIVADSAGGYKKAECGAKPRKGGNGWSVNSDGLPLCDKCRQYVEHNRVMDGLLTAEEDEQ